ncbi:uncharacterized protein LOC129602085 [Paramacrobiotus metropolitanus]|uniref:uncharacterized protein LOC129602085 n=1 Tax=Paramacrobiotus metropolitanus TaxID=2943436 RepID=UPI002445D8BB|nr:uncharacterized protein LOC129602085 [Paramacrobiotus metropolitanus]
MHSIADVESASYYEHIFEYNNPDSFFDLSTPVLVDKCPETYRTIFDKPIGSHHNIDELKQWWSNQKSDHNIDYRYNLDKIRAIRHHLTKLITNRISEMQWSSTHLQKSSSEIGLMMPLIHSSRSPTTARSAKSPHRVPITPKLHSKRAERKLFNDDNVANSISMPLKTEGLSPMFTGNEDTCRRLSSSSHGSITIDLSENSSTASSHDMSSLQSSATFYLRGNENPPSLSSNESEFAVPMIGQRSPSLEESLCQEVNRRSCEFRKVSHSNSRSSYLTGFEQVAVTLDYEEEGDICITPAEIEFGLQQLIDDSVHNLTWATKTLFKYRSLVQSRQRLAELKHESATFLPVTFDEPCRFFVSTPQLPSQKRLSKEANKRDIVSLTSVPHALHEEKEYRHADPVESKTTFSECEGEKQISFQKRDMNNSHTQKESDREAPNLSHTPASMDDVFKNRIPKMVANQTLTPAQSHIQKAEQNYSEKQEISDYSPGIFTEDHPTEWGQTFALGAVPCSESNAISPLSDCSSCTLEAEPYEMNIHFTKRLSKDSEHQNHPDVQLDFRYLKSCADFMQELEAASGKRCSAEPPSSQWLSTDSSVRVAPRLHHFKSARPSNLYNESSAPATSRAPSVSDENCLESHAISDENGIDFEEGAENGAQQSLLIHLPIMTLLEKNEPSAKLSFNQSNEMTSTCIYFYWNHNLKQFGLDKRRAAGIYAKIEMLEKCMKGILNSDSAASRSRIQANDLSRKVIENLCLSGEYLQIWPRSHPVEARSIKLMVIVPDVLCEGIFEENLREGLYYLRNIMQSKDKEILIISSK